MILFRIILSILFVSSSLQTYAQSDSTITALQNIPVKYIEIIDKKISTYSSRITNKTEKTLEKLSKWENKIHTLLLKVNPDAASRLFGNDQITFSNVLQKIKEGQQVIENYREKYDEYRDRLTTSMKYLDQQKEKLKDNLVKPINEVNSKLTELKKLSDGTDVVEQFIKERKKQLINEAVKYLGNSKYLTKIDKEAYYYIETLRNYKEIFNDRKKAEDLAYTILDKIPAFKRFEQNNSQLAALFGRSSGTNATMQSIAGLQTRSNVQSLIQARLASGGPNAQQQFNQNMQMARDQLRQLKDKVVKSGGKDIEAPDFKPNMQKTKTFFQRIEYGGNFQFSKNNSLLPSTADIGLSLGYKINDKSIVGVGASYKMGLGSVKHISISHQGIGFRSFMDWKFKKQFFISGGFEMNHNAQFHNIAQLQNFAQWQQAGLIGITKKMSINTKWFKATKLQLLYDLLSRSHIPYSQPILFRVGYSLKN